MSIIGGSMKNTNIVPQTIDNTPIGISIYSVKQEYCHHHNKFLEIIYCLKGNATLHVLYEDIDLTDGDIISCDPHDVHSLSSKEENLFVSFYFDLTHPVFNNPDLQHMFFVCERYVLRKESQEQLQKLKHLLLTLLYFYCFPHEKVSQVDTFNNLALKIMAIMLEHFHFFNYVTGSLDYSQDAKNRLEHIMIYTNRYYYEKLTLSRIGEEEHINPTYLSHFFKKTTFFGYSGFLNFVRTYQSELLLLETDMKISDISYACGFSDPKFYYKQFKIWYRHTPLQHRKLLKEIEQNSVENHYYKVDEISSKLEHYISYYFATLHIPEFWNVPYIPYRNIPVNSDSSSGDCSSCIANTSSSIQILP